MDERVVVHPAPPLVAMWEPFHCAGRRDEARGNYLRSGGTSVFRPGEFDPELDSVLHLRTS